MRLVVDVGQSEALIGTSTVGSMRAGLTFCHVAMVAGNVVGPRLAWRRNDATREGRGGTPAL